jgi:hypothetical protein
MPGYRLTLTKQPMLWRAETGGLFAQVFAVSIVLLTKHNNFYGEMYAITGQPVGIDG